MIQARQYLDAFALPPEAIAFMKRYYCQRLPLAIANKYRYHPVAIPASTILLRY
ncbi:hypothetical protein [Nostoc sp. 'Lobaria pulmonaria (5183) cyanobiont']|uniref:hypothetical protein n=1 Tax=Nostoc sp. 'Lobaria pulmonaria (5183) cyanobiont' TaxID=1618022 RepID=UPI00131A4789|nr:hypothetical protein [Nostoc sp. 'Lobaria pulmonaria (5183) cyanobiont']